MFENFYYLIYLFEFANLKGTNAYISESRKIQICIRITQISRA